MEYCNVLQQLSALAHTLNTEHGWELSAEALRSYAEAISESCIMLGNASPAQLRQLLSNYHHDYPRVAALRDAEHTAHLDTWDQVRHEVRGTLLRLYHTHRLTVMFNCIEDLTQDATENIWHGLDRFRYHSRFSTWQYQVVVRSALRGHRTTCAKRRGAGTEVDSLDALREFGSPRLEAPQPPRPEEYALHDDLRRIIAVTLGAAPDTRLLAIFELREYDDYTIREIGSKLHLSAARVSDLLQQAKQILSTNPAVRAWFREELAL